jgi:uncharacterized short protein YbdD (DUF466 family)
MKPQSPSVWRCFRAVIGDDAYERYLDHHAKAHRNTVPLSRREFYEDELKRKWNGGVSRCC